MRKPTAHNTLPALPWNGVTQWVFLDFDTYTGEKMQVTGEQASAGGTIITSQIVKSNGEPVNINYLMRQNGGGWQIADVYLNGTISELATRRSEFASILRTQGINGLIQQLNQLLAAHRRLESRCCAGRPGRRLLAGTAGLAAVAGLAAFWTMQGQFRGW